MLCLLGSPKHFSVFFQIFFVKLFLIVLARLFTLLLKQRYPFSDLVLLVVRDYRVDQIKATPQPKLITLPGEPLFLTEKFLRLLHLFFDRLLTRAFFALTWGKRF